MKKYKIILLAILSGVCFSCDDFLEKAPSKSTSIVPENIEQLEALLNQYKDFINEPSNELIFSTDDYGFVPDLFKASKTTYGTTEVIYGLWDTNLAAATTTGNYWPVEWKKIFTANLILQNLSKVKGSAEEKAEIEAECHFIRAYSYFQLVNIYCLPFTQETKSELGLPIKQTTVFTEDMQRVSLEQTYAFIESDLKQALMAKRPFLKTNGLNRSWRSSTAAVNSFAARYYLSLNDYNNAQKYAQKSLDEYSELRNYNTNMSFSVQPYKVTIFNPQATQVDLFFPYTHDQPTMAQDRFGFGETYYFRVMVNNGWKYWPSQELLALYDKAYDLRYKFHIVEDYSYDQGRATNPPYSYPGYIFFYRSDLPSGPSVSEMILTKAECQVRLGDFSGGILTVNQLRAARMSVGAPQNVINLSANSSAEALTKVLEERRREMPFVHRWLDIRRFNNNSDASDDVVVKRTFYPFNANTILGSETPINYTLEKNSRRYAFPLPNADIISSNGALKQNKY